MSAIREFTNNHIRPTTAIQQALKKLGYDPGPIDGTLGPSTQAAIRRFQQANGLPTDGSVTPQTKAALAKALQGQMAPAAGAGAVNGNGKSLPQGPVAQQAKTGAAAASGAPPQPASGAAQVASPPPAENVLPVSAARSASSSNVSRPRDQLIRERQEIEKRLNKQQDYQGREADEARLQEIIKELDSMPADHGAPDGDIPAAGAGGPRKPDGGTQPGNPPPPPKKPNGPTQKGNPPPPMPPPRQPPPQQPPPQQPPPEGGGGPKKPMGGTQDTPLAPPPQPPPKQPAPPSADDIKKEYEKWKSTIQPEKLGPGDGEEVPIEKVFQTLEKTPEVVARYGTNYHEVIWERQLGMKGKPPPAFKLKGHIEVDYDRLTKEQMARFELLSNPQALANKINKILKDADNFFDQYKNLEKRQGDNAAKQKEGGGDKAALEKEARQLARERAFLESEAHAIESQAQALNKEVQALEGTRAGETVKKASAKLQTALDKLAAFKKPTKPPGGTPEGGGKEEPGEPGKKPEAKPGEKPEEAGGGEGGTGAGAGEGSTGKGGAGNDAQKVFNDVDVLLDRVNKIKELSEGTAKGLNDLQAKQKQGGGNAEDLAKEKLKLSEQRAAVEKTVVETFKEHTELVRKLNGLPEEAVTSEAGKSAGSKLLTAFTLLTAIATIGSGTSREDILMRTVGVEVSVLEGAVVSAFAATAFVGIAAGFLLELPGDTSESEAAMRARLQAAQKAKEDAWIRSATFDVMEKVKPGSVVGSGPERWYAGPEYKELYDETIVLVREHLEQKKKEAAAAQIKQSKFHAHRLGVEDGLTGERTQKDDAVPKARTSAGVPFELELNSAYESGFKEGQAAVEKALKRAHDLGAKDRKDGKPADSDALKNSPGYDGNWNRFVAAYTAGYTGG